MRYFLDITFRGTNYFGWQKQSNATGLQDLLSNKLSLLFGEAIYALGCGRTDTGVHARHFFLHFDSLKELPFNFHYKLNSFLPIDVSLNAVYQALDPLLHSRFSAISRSYRYYISLGKEPLSLGYSAQIYQTLDVEAMKLACTFLLNYNQFEGLSKKSSAEKHYLVKMESVKLIKKNNVLIFEIKANRFLRGMVRIIVGTLIDIGKGVKSPEIFNDILLNKNRNLAGGAASAEGLYLWEIKYPEGSLSKIEHKGSKQ